MICELSVPGFVKPFRFFFMNPASRTAATDELGFYLKLSWFHLEPEPLQFGGAAVQIKAQLFGDVFHDTQLSADH